MKEKELLEQLEQYEKEGYLHSIDIAFTRFLLQTNPGISTDVLLAACLTSYYYRQGNVCMWLNEFDNTRLFPEADSSLKPLHTPSLDEWKTALSKSSVVGRPDTFTPLILDKNRLYLHKLWAQEQQLGQNLIELGKKRVNEFGCKQLLEGLNRLFPSSETFEIDWQKVAAVAAVLQPFTVISGGPGTGKTTTVVRILALLLEQTTAGETLEIALAAPTGKAAARLKRSIEEQRDHLETDSSIIEQIPQQTFTIHRLLGSRLQSDSFKYNEENKLPYDLVIVDEVSMADQRLMNSLLKAMKVRSRLILLGDKDQLASVEAGSVLGDICGAATNRFSASFHTALKKLNIKLPEKHVAKNPSTLTDNIVLLEQNFRFEKNSGITLLTSAIKRGEADVTIGLLNDNTNKDIDLKSIESFNEFWDEYESFIKDYFQAIRHEKSLQVLAEKLQQFIILCAHRRGPFGVKAVNIAVEKMLYNKGIISGIGEWYDGRPVIIRRNNAQMCLRNGDIGICRRDKNDEWIILFPETNKLTLRKVHPDRLPEYDVAYALTIHQSQGSEYDNVLLVLPDKLSKILTRELLYTAVSRTRKTVTIFARKKIIKEAISKKLTRHSGLEEILWS